jgi:hypothetical protein
MHHQQSNMYSRSTTTTRPCLFSSHVGHSSSAEWSVTLLESIDRPQHRHRMRTHSTNARTWTATNARASNRLGGKTLWMRQSTQSEFRAVSCIHRGLPRYLMISSRALRATMHIRSPDRSRSGSAQLFGGPGGEDAEIARYVLLSISGRVLESNPLRRAIAASLQEATSNDGGGQGSSNGIAGLTEDEMLAMCVVFLYASFLHTHRLSNEAQ